MNGVKTVKNTKSGHATQKQRGYQTQFDCRTEYNFRKVIWSRSVISIPTSFYNANLFRTLAKSLLSEETTLLGYATTKYAH